jgi:hypothetical protein
VQFVRAEHRQVLLRALIAFAARQRLSRDNAIHEQNKSGRPSFDPSTGEQRARFTVQYGVLRCFVCFARCAHPPRPQRRLFTLYQKVHALLPRKFALA